MVCLNHVLTLHKVSRSVIDTLHSVRKCPKVSFATALGLLSQVLVRARTDALPAVRKLNLWGQDLCDVGIVSRMPNLQAAWLSLGASQIFALATSKSTAVS